MAAKCPDDHEVSWPSVAGPAVPDRNPKLWKAPRLDMSSSLAILRRELACMQLQDRGLHKQLLTLNSAIRDLKTNLDDSWELESHSDVNLSSTSNQSNADVAEREILCSTNSNSPSTQVSHSKQDSGILTDEESSEECDVFDSEDSDRPTRPRSKSVICLPSGYSPELDINQNFKNTTKGNSFRGYNLSIPPRPKSHTVSEGQFHRVTSMPVINEDPSTTASSKVSGNAFAIYGYLNRPASSHRQNMETPLTRYGSMPIIPSFDKATVRHVRSETVPFHKRIHKSFLTRSRRRSLDTTALGSNRTLQKNKPLYRIWRSSSQISLV